MKEADIIVECISRNGKMAYFRAKECGGAYTVRGNSIVRTNSDGSTVVVRSIEQVKVRLKKNEKVRILE